MYTYRQRPGQRHRRGGALPHHLPARGGGGRLGAGIIFVIPSIILPSIGVISSMTTIIAIRIIIVIVIMIMIIISRDIGTIIHTLLLSLFLFFLLL